MKKSYILKTLLLSSCMMATNVFAQLSSNPDKFLGNITTRYNVDTDGIQYWTLWNQITPENESKWGSVEGSKGKFNWGGSDNCANYARNHKFPFKFHALIWGAQHPNWFNADLSIYDRKTAILNWMTEAKNHYSKIDIIDVANECVAGHQPDTYLFQEPLGGTGMSGWDWLVKAFEMAHERWPEAILVYNDFNTFQWNTDQYIDLVTRLRDAGAPIDAYGCQSHDLTDCSIANFKNSMAKIQNALKMPMYISEYDLGTYDDNHQKNQLAAQFPVMWEADYCAGVTMWGFIYGATWTDNGNSGLIRDGVDRPAMTWLREYMSKPEAAKTKSPFPGMKKPISLYIKPAKYKSPINEPCAITVDATMHNGKAIEKVELYVNNTLAATMTQAPYVYDYTPVNENKVNFKAIVYTSDGKTYERLGGMYGSKWPQRPYSGAPCEIPGVLEAEDYDMGGESISYHTSRTSPTSNYYRDDAGNLGIYSVTGGGFCIDQLNEGDWLDYTVNVTKSGKLNFEAVVSSMATEGTEFTMFIYKDGDMKKQNVISVPYTGRKKFANITGDMGMRFVKGEYKIRLYFNKAKVGIDKIYIGTTATGIDETTTFADGGQYSVYTTSGVLVGNVEAADKSELVRNVKTVAKSSGIYVVKNVATGKSHSVVVK